MTSWLIILRKQKEGTGTFTGFDIDKIARYTGHRCCDVLADDESCATRAKIEATLRSCRSGVVRDLSSTVVVRRLGPTAVDGFEIPSVSTESKAMSRG